MGSLDAFIHHENLMLFKKQLADPRLADGLRQQFVRLLEEEEAKDLSVEKDYADSPLRPPQREQHDRI